MGIEKGVDFPIAAIDQFSDIFAKLKSQVKDAQGSFDGLKGALMAALGGISVAGLGLMVKSTVEAMSHLEDLSKATSLSVETLSGLSVAAKQSGADLDTMAGLLGKLSVNIGKNAEAFGLLGIKTKDPLEALKILADRFVGIEDPMQRDAVMAAALGKAWQGAAPLLALGGQRIGEMVAKGSELSKVTTEMAEQAKDLSDKWVQLTGSGGFLYSQVGALLPILNTLADTFINVQKSANADGGGSAFNPMVEALRAIVVLGGNVVFVVKGIGTEIGVWLAQIGALSEAVTALKMGRDDDAAASLKQFGQISDDATQRAAAARTAFDAWEKKMMEVGTAADRMGASVAAANKQVDYSDQVSRKAASDNAAAARAFLDHAKDKASAAQLESYYDHQMADAEKAVSVALAEQANGAERLTTSQKKLLEVVKDPEFKKLPDWEKQNIKDQLTKAAAIEQVTAGYKRYAEAIKAVQASAEQDKSERDQIEMAGQATVASLRDQVEQYQLEADAVGKTSQQRELMNVALQRERAMRGNLSSSQRAAVASYYDEIEALVKLRQAHEDESAVANALGDAEGKFFSDLVFDGKNAFSNLTDAAKKFGAELLAIFAKKYGLQMVGNLIGGSAGSALTQAGMSAGSGTVAGAAGSYLGSAISGTTIGGTAIGGFSDLAAGYQGVSSLGMTAAEVGAGEGATWMSSLGAYLAEIPVWGWIAAAVLAVAVWLSGKGGGPKIGGSYTGGFTGAGDPLGAMAAPGTENGRLFTPNDGDSQMQQLITGVGHSFGAALSSLGGTSGGVRFGIGFDSDPHGTAPDRVSSVVSDLGGNVLYSHNNVVPADGQKLEDLLSLESQRMILAALQASNLPKDVANILNTLDAKTATADQIQKVIALAQSFEQLSQTIDALQGGPLVALQQQLKGMDTSVDTAKQAFATALQGTDQGAIMTAEQQLEQAVLNRYSTEISMVQQLQGMIRQTEEAAYQFAISIAGKINSVGGSRDIGAIAMNRAGVLRSGIGADQPNPVDLQIEDLNSYVGTIDTWYQARSSQIQHDAQQQAAQQQALAQAGAAAAQAREQGLQKELELAQQFQGLVDRTTQMLTDMKLGSTNPASIFERLRLSQQDVAGLQSSYETASGADKVTAANKLLDALDQEKQLGMEAYANGRPSQEWQDLYNSIVSEITQVGADAKPEADRALDLQQQILDAQKEAEGYQAAAAAATADTSAAMDELNSEALPYYTWAEGEGERLYALQRQQHQEQLDAITGGMEVNLFIASKQAEAVEELKGIRSLLATWAAANPASAGNGPGSNSGNNSGNGNTDTPDPRSSAVSDGDVIAVVKRNPAVISRILANA